MVKWDDLDMVEKITCMNLFPEEGKQDDDWSVRLHAYRALGFTEESLKDQSAEVRQEAENYFNIKNKLESKDKSDDQSELKIIKEIYEKLKKYLGE
jgi:hypothetical protein